MSNAHFEWLIMRCLELQIYKNFKCTLLSPHYAFSHSKPNLTTQRNARLRTRRRHPLRTSKRTKATTRAAARSAAPSEESRTQNGRRREDSAPHALWDIPPIRIQLECASRTALLFCGSSQRVGLRLYPLRPFPAASATILKRLPR